MGGVKWREMMRVEWWKGMVSCVKNGEKKKSKR